MPDDAADEELDVYDDDVQRGMWYALHFGPREEN